VTEPLRHLDGVRIAEFSPDGERVVTGSHDRTARIWDARTAEPLSEPFRHQGWFGWVSCAHFSPDGKWVITASSENSGQLWEAPMAPLPVARWLAELAEAIAGQRLNAQGAFEPVPWEELFRIKRQLAESSATDYYTRWGKWFFADRGTRTISPSSTMTVPQYVQRLVEENSQRGLQQALFLSPTNSLAFARLARLMLEDGTNTNPGQLSEADFLSRHALQLSPTNTEVLEIRAETEAFLRRKTVK
jgi:hypothetical protein